jgi:hypothetical protein
MQMHPNVKKYLEVCTGLSGIYIRLKKTDLNQKRYSEPRRAGEYENPGD